MKGSDAPQPMIQEEDLPSCDDANRLAMPTGYELEDLLIDVEV